MRVLIVDDSGGLCVEGVKRAFEDSYRRCLDSVQFSVRDPSALREFLFDASLGCADPVGLQRFKALDCVIVQTKYSAAWLPTNLQLRQLLVQVILHSKPCLLFSGAFFSLVTLLATKGLRFSVFAQGAGVARLAELTALAPVINHHDLYLDLNTGDLWRKSHEFGGWRKTANLGLKAHTELTPNVGAISGVKLIGNSQISVRNVVHGAAYELGQSVEMSRLLSTFVQSLVSGNCALSIPDGAQLLELDIPRDSQSDQNASADLRRLQQTAVCGGGQSRVYVRAESQLLLNPLYGGPGM